MSEQSNERVSDERLAEMLVVEAKKIRKGGPIWGDGETTTLIDEAARRLQQRRASAVTPDLEKAAQRMLELLVGDSYPGILLIPEDVDANDFASAYADLEAALSVVSHETGDGETEVGPKLWGREPGSGHWVQIDDGSHTDAEVTSFEADYVAAGWTDLRRTNPFCSALPAPPITTEGE